MEDKFIFYLILAVILLNLILPGEIYKTNLIIATLIIIILTVIKGVRIISEKRECLFLPHPFILLLTFLFIALSSKESVYFAKTRDYLFLSLTYFLIFFLITNLKSNKRQKEIFLFAILIATGIVVTYALYQYTVSLPLIPEILEKMKLPPEVKEEILKRLSQKRVFATFALPTTLSGFLAIVSPFSLLYFAISLRDRKHLLLSSSLLAGLILVMVLAGSFGGPFVLVGGTTLALLFLVKKGKNILIAIGIALLLTLLLIPISKKRGAPIWKISTPENPIALRLDNWVIGGRIIADHPITGVGLGNYGTVYPQYKRKEWGETQFAHNTLIQWGAEMGPIGGLLPTLFIVLLFLRAIIRLRKRKRKNLTSFETGFPIALATSCFILFLHNLIDINYYFPSLGLLGALIFSLFIGESGLPSKKNIPLPRLSPRKKGIIITALLASAFLLIILFFIPFLGEIVASEAKRSFENGEYEKALSQIRFASRLDPENSNHPLLEAEIILAEGGKKPSMSDIEQAISLYKKGIELNYFTPYLHYQLSKLYYIRGELINAYYQAEEARRLYPTKKVYREWRDEVKKRLEEEIKKQP